MRRHQQRRELIREDLSRTVFPQGRRLDSRAVRFRIPLDFRPFIERLRRRDLPQKVWGDSPTRLSSAPDLAVAIGHKLPLEQMTECTWSTTSARRRGT